MTAVAVEQYRPAVDSCMDGIRLCMRCALTVPDPSDPGEYPEEYCDSGLDSIESPGILTIIDGPEHAELSQVYSHLSSYHVGSHVPTLS